MPWFLVPNHAAGPAELNTLEIIITKFCPSYKFGLPYFLPYVTLYIELIRKIKNALDQHKKIIDKFPEFRTPLKQKN